MKIDRKPTSVRCGFTLIELLAVIGIIGLLLSLSVVGYRSVRESAKVKKQNVECAIISTAVERYRAQLHSWPVKPPDYFLTHTNYSESADNYKIINLLTGMTPPGIEIEMFETNSTGSVVDPWKVPYVITITHMINNECVSVTGSH